MGGSSTTARSTDSTTARGAGPRPSRSCAGCASTPADSTSTIDDQTDDVAALALQGPLARAVLESAAQTSLDGPRLLPTPRRSIGRHDPAVDVSRTGYTGDLGYELWLDRADALAVWDALDGGRVRVRAAAGRHPRARRRAHRGRPDHGRGRLHLGPPRADARPELVAVRARARAPRRARQGGAVRRPPGAAGGAGARRARRGGSSGSTSTGTTSRRSTAATGCRRRCHRRPGATRSRSSAAGHRSVARRAGRGARS